MSVWFFYDFSSRCNKKFFFRIYIYIWCRGGGLLLLLLSYILTIRVLERFFILYSSPITRHNNKKKKVFLYFWLVLWCSSGGKEYTVCVCMVILEFFIHSKNVIFAQRLALFLSSLFSLVFLPLLFLNHSVWTLMFYAHYATVCLWCVLTIRKIRYFQNQLERLFFFFFCYRKRYGWHTTGRNKRQR